MTSPRNEILELPNATARPSDSLPPLSSALTSEASVAAIVNEAASLMAPSDVPHKADPILSSSSDTPNSIANVNAIVTDILGRKEGGGGDVDVSAITRNEADVDAEGNSNIRKSHPWNDAPPPESDGSPPNNDSARDTVRPKKEEGKETPRAPPGDFDPEDPDYHDVCEELGINFSSHPHLRAPYRRFRVAPRTALRALAIVGGLAGVVVAVASVVHRRVARDAGAPKAAGKMREKKAAKHDEQWWEGELGYGEGGKDGDAPSPATEPAAQGLTAAELEQLSYSISEAYLPMWFEQNTGWSGHTYHDAIQFCKSKDNFVPCPYDVYCPGKTGSLIFGESISDARLSWAPIMDMWNEWVQVADGKSQCVTYSGMYKRQPSWGLLGGEDTNGENRDHIMCCLENPLGDGFSAHELPRPPDVILEHGEGVDDPIPPPPVSNAYQTIGLDSALTSVEKVVESYNPFWFDDKAGWEGTTYSDAMAFCESIPDGFGTSFYLCPLEAYCPNLGNTEKRLIYKTNFDEGIQWSPINDQYNTWIMAGAGPTCRTFQSLQHHDPSWGIDGSKPELKKHILCCQNYSGGDSIQKGELQSVENADATPTQAENISVASAKAEKPKNEESHTGAGNSAPQPGEHSEEPIKEMKHFLQPVWYNIKSGWAGGTHDDAEKFCELKNKALCPKIAYCPQGPTRPVLDGRHQSANDEASDQWAPVRNGKNQWILIETRDGDTSTQCMDYATLMDGQEPSWGKDGSQMEHKKHILCCNRADSSSSNPQSSDKEAADTEQASGTWFHITNGWNAGSHDDAVHYCAIKKINGMEMELCPYAAYCPSGPSFPPVEGRGEIVIDEESEQWAPTSDGDQWVMIGYHGHHNKASQCLTAGQLYSSASLPDEVSARQKHYIRCCKPT